MLAGTRFSYRNLLTIPRVGGFAPEQISPDGKKILFSWDRNGEDQIYQVDLNNLNEPDIFSTGPGANISPRYSPNGRYFAYLHDLDGSETYELCLYDLSKNLQIQLKLDTVGSLQPNITWSPDGKYLAYISDETGIFRTYVVELDVVLNDPGGIHSRLLFDYGGPHWSMSFSPDNLWIAIVAESKGQDYAAYIISLANPDLQGSAVVNQYGQILNIPSVAWSPDSSNLAFASDPKGVYEIGIFDLASGKISWLPTAKGEKSMPIWSPDGKKLAFILSRGPETWVGVHFLSENQNKLFQIGPGVHTSPVFMPDGERILVSFSSPSQPNDLWLLNVVNQTFQQLTQSLPNEVMPIPAIQPDHITYPGFDGEQVPALIYAPPGLKKPGPAVIVLHGGPNWLFQFEWMPLFQQLVELGYVVMAPNYRGSTGYGRGWQQANIYDMGGRDAEDVVAGVDELIRLGLADPERVAITGRSYGGYLVLVCMTRFPDRWAGGSAIAPFVNWFTCHENARDDLKIWDIENMGDPEKQEKLWRERSPYYFLDRLQAPVQLIAGGNDVRCPVSEAIAASDRLLSSGKPVECLVYPDEGHVFIKQKNILDKEFQRIRFLNRILCS